METVEEALAVLAEHGEEAKVLAGGQSLIPLLNMRLARPAVLVDVNRVAALAALRTDGAVHLGAMTRQRAAERSELIRAELPLLALALRYVGHPAIRSRGTIGGSAAHADPAAEIPAVLAALDATFTARGPAGERRLSAEQFFVSTLTTGLAAGELLTEITVAPQAPTSRSAFLEVERRHGDFALAGVAATLDLSADGRIERARICFSSLAAVPYRARAAERALAGQRLDDAAAHRAAAAMAAAEASPASDLHATAEDRRDLAAELLRRALEQMAAAGGH